MMPRLMLAAPASGAGKTTVTCALLRAFQNRGLKLMACKSGPDYIDPMFHSQIIGAKSRNLDLFFFKPHLARALLAKNARECDLTILEGAMGYYDGIGMGSDASAWALAGATETPTVLVVDGRGAALSVAATVKGFQALRAPSWLGGVILNRVSGMLYPRLAEAITRETGLPVFGYLPVLPDCSIESRHLGLLTAAEVDDLKGKVSALGRAAESSLDLEGLLSLAQTAAELTEPLPEIHPVTACHPRIAIAQDRAFCFYYQDALDLLEQLGAELVPFSPLEDGSLPEQISGLYLGGGYPELYAQQLSENPTLLAQIKAAVSAGLPTIAECGGFLYLHRSLRDERGRSWPMAGVIPAEAFPTGRLGRFGYITLTARESGLLLKKGEQLHAHEFHYWDSTAPGEAFLAEKPQSTRSWQAGYSTESLYAGFPHTHFWAGRSGAARFVKACAAYQENL